MSTTVAAPTGLLRIADLSAVQLNAVLDLADDMRAGPSWWESGPRGGAVACLFREPLTGSSVAFEVAAQRLGLLPVRVRPDELLGLRGAALQDAARLLSSNAEAIVVGASTQHTLAELSRAATVPVLNAMSDAHHPCQALGDLLTVRRHFGYLDGLRLVWIGDATNVAHSLLEAGGLAGMHVVVATPSDGEPDRDIAARAAAIADAHGGSVHVGRDPRGAVMGADVVYASAPTHAGHARDPADLRAYRVDAGLMRLADPRAVVLHGTPGQRGEEVTADVLDGPASLAGEQAADAVPSRQALLHAVVTGTLDG
jgi:ornithine carbamoyltransferase